jgi:cation diffusion facilitator CzcD-associated flavoprotein CzcO
MKNHVVEADYVIIGAGATALAFADTMLSESDAAMVLVDRRHRPGGHWNDAYPFIRLHSPAIFYGVNSVPLRGDRINATGPNRGHLELATGSEICGYFDQEMHHRFQPSKRRKFLPLQD